MQKTPCPLPGWVCCCEFLGKGPWIYLALPFLPDPFSPAGLPLQRKLEHCEMCSDRGSKQIQWNDWRSLGQASRRKDHVRVGVSSYPGKMLGNRKECQQDERPLPEIWRKKGTQDIEVTP